VENKKKIGIIGGLDILSDEVLAHQDEYHFLFEQQSDIQMGIKLHSKEGMRSKKLHTYTVAKRFEDSQADRILLFGLDNHIFIKELQAELTVPIVSMVDALHSYVKANCRKGAKLGILTSDFVKASDMLKGFEADYEIVYPDKQELLMDAVYGEKGIKKGFLDGVTVEQVFQICKELTHQGCAVILPGISELSCIVDTLQRKNLPALDVDAIYTEYALDIAVHPPVKSFKLGVLGGVGPSATVDFMSKIIRETPAQRDQDHIKMVVEQNPQIPDRTANLVYGGEDPTIALFATCKRLEAEGADAIAIPCNTAHAFVEDIQQSLKIPIINMLEATVDHIIAQYGKDIVIGLLATDGTIASRVYHHVAERYSLQVITPDPEYQKKVMDSIYGPCGVKAGYTTGPCKTDIDEAVRHIIDKGAQVCILGCTELPLLFPHETSFAIDGLSIPLIDPTLVLAKRCVQLSISV